MQLKKTALAVLTALALVACGGGDDGPRYDKLVSFGDSLSDVGSYKTAGIAAMGGGKYTVNGLPDGVWVEQLAAKLGLPTLCPAQTGLNASGPFEQLKAPVVDHKECTAYGQGGSRVTNPIGPWNTELTKSSDPGEAYTGQLGQLTEPVVAQIAKHLGANGGSFSGKELVTVLAGANDVFVTIDAVSKGKVTPEAAGLAMATAGTELAALVKAEILGKGAKSVVVLNLPNIGKTPAITEAGPLAKELADALTAAFNAQLAGGLKDVEGVLLVDLYTQNTDHHANPRVYGLTNVSAPACDNDFAGIQGFLGSSLVCSTKTLNPGDVSHYLFADDIHPTPYGHSLLRDMTLKALQAARWD